MAQHRAIDYVDNEDLASVTKIEDWELPARAQVQQIDPPDGDEGHETIAFWLEWPDKQNNTIEVMVKVPIDYTVTD